LSYSRWLRTGYFASQEDLARQLNISTSQVSRLLKLARLPAVVVEAFPSPVDIREEWGLELIDALSDERTRRATIRCARTIATRSPRLTAGEVFRELLAASAGGRRIKQKPRDEVILDKGGLPLFRVRQQRSTVAILLPVKKVSADSMKAISRAISDVLQSERKEHISPKVRAVDLSEVCPDAGGA
jgi:ParB family chromosome partitioning protein